MPETVHVKIPDTAFNILSKAVNDVSDLKKRLQQANEKLSDLCTVSVEISGYTSSEYTVHNLDANSNEIILIKKESLK